MLELSEGMFECRPSRIRSTLKHISASVAFVASKVALRSQASDTEPSLYRNSIFKSKHSY